jgi:AcrR family transcriptional regulator
MKKKARNSKDKQGTQATQRGPKTRISRSAAQLRVRRDPSQARAKQTVDVIIEAAGQLLVAHGRAAVTTNAVAERAGVSIGSLYQYFPNKESIFSALQERHRDQVMPLIHHALAHLSDPGVDLVDGIVALMRAMAELHKGNPARMRVLVEELREEADSVNIDPFAKAMVAILRQRTRRPTEMLRPIAWLTCLTVTHVGRTLVHRPPALDIASVLDALACMLRGLFAGLEQPEVGWKGGSSPATA